MQSVPGAERNTVFFQNIHRRDPLDDRLYMHMNEHPTEKTKVKSGITAATNNSQSPNSEKRAAPTVASKSNKCCKLASWILAISPWANCRHTSTRAYTSKNDRVGNKHLH